MSAFAVVRRAVVAVLPLLAGLALGSMLVVSGFVGWRVLTDWQDFTQIAKDNSELLQLEQGRSEDLQARLDVLEGRIAGMVAQHDQNNHDRHVTGHPRAPVVVPRPIQAQTTTATTRPPRRTTTTTRQSPPPSQTTTTKPQGRPPCTTTPAGCAPEPTTP